MPNREDFLENVRRGNWHMVLKTMQGTRMDMGAVQSIYEQVVRELVVEREWALAQGILREQSQILS
jgi:hypothetical protein